MEISLSIRIIIQLITSYLDVDSAGESQRATTRIVHPLISQRLATNGWCPSTIRRLQDMRNDCLAYYISQMRTPQRPDFSHRSCPDTHCVASNTQLSGRYRSAHTHAQERACDFVAVDQRKVIKILSEGAIPLVSIKVMSDGKFQFGIHKAKGSDCYVAISHVWFDGLGNPKENALPACQVQRLAYFLQNLPHPHYTSSRDGLSERHSFTMAKAWGPIHMNGKSLNWSLRKASRSQLFWLDTLCIPVATGQCDEESSPIDETKKRAIDQMAIVYGQASQVLVLDYVLLRSRLAVLSEEEILARVTFSGWMGRSWTLQEGAMSPYVHFQCEDGAICPPTRLEFFQRLNLPSDYRLTILREYITLAWQNRNVRRTTANRFDLHVSKNIVFTPLNSICKESFYGMGYRLHRDLNIDVHDSRKAERLIAVW